MVTDAPRRSEAAGLVPQLDAARSALSRPWDARGLVAFRFLFGLVLFAAVLRFLAKGWVEELYLAPSIHFPYAGLEWIRALPPTAMYGLFAIMAVTALGVAIGIFTRASAALFCAAFTYVELIDKTAYLNHYYFVSLVTFLLAVVPSGSRSRMRERQPVVPAYSYLVLRFQLAVVYFFAGLAKLDSDWLLRAEPLSTWLSARADMPVLGTLFTQSWFAYAASWAGAAFDLSIVPLMLWPRTRRFAYVAAVLFHGFVWLLFPIGVFSPIMLVSLTLLFHPSWPARFMPRAQLGATASPPVRTLSRSRLAVLVAYAAAQLLIPLRFVLYPGEVNWTEQGFRFAWRVMLIEKTGQVEYRVETEQPRISVLVQPRAELTPFQYRMLSTQPDMIHDYALRIAERFRNGGHRGVKVYASAFASLNGRPSQPLVDESFDLASVAPSLAPSPWIVPGARSGSEIAATPGP